MLHGSIPQMTVHLIVHADSESGFYHGIGCVNIHSRKLCVGTDSTPFKHPGVVNILLRIGFNIRLLLKPFHRKCLRSCQFTIIRQHNHHLQQFYNAIDALVIERFAGTDEFAAIGIAGTVMNLFLFAIVGICTGFSILLAKHYGAGDLKQFRRQHFTALVLGLFCTVLLSLAGFVLLSRLMKLIQTPEDLMPYVLTYLRIILLIHKKLLPES